MITVTILTKNSERHLKEVLDSVKSFDEVLLLDNGSTDGTFEIARGYSNVTIREAEFIGFGPLHNLAIDLARNDWILSLDSDEVLTPELVDEIHRVTLNPKAVYAFSRHNFYNGKLIWTCGWYPDFQVRLFNRMSTRFTNAQVHEGVICKGMEPIELKHPVRHYSYDSTDDFLNKMQSYSSLFAKQRGGKRKASIAGAVLRGLHAFYRSYFRYCGFLGGKEGFLISVYNANTAFYKYVKLAERDW